MTNYKEMDQTSWVCYQFPGKAYYYGQVAILDENGAIFAKDSPQAANPKNKLVKHGFGIYIYRAGGEGQNSRYEGYWDKDRKQGQGKLTVPGQFTYEGQFKDGIYHEQGRIAWVNGDSYEGGWKKGRMQGGGLFKNHEGFVLKGSFKASHFIEDNILRNPQMGERQYELFKKQRKEVIKQKERNEKIKHGFVSKVVVSDLEKIHELCAKSNKNNRVPLIISSEDANFNVNNLQSTLSTNGKTHNFDLRKAYTLKGQEKYNYKQNFGEMTRSVIIDGGSLIINLDESQVEYKQMFYPELKEFYDANGFNNNTWSRDLIKRKEISEKLIGNNSINNDYLLAVWSKIKLDQALNEERVREKLQLRFETILPFIKIDIIFIVAPQK